MRISENWLREWVNPVVDVKILCDQLTAAGLEVDSCVDSLPEKETEGLKDILAQHPDLIKLINKLNHYIELDLTPNRGDCLSYLGIAREIAALNNIKLNLPDVATIQSKKNIRQVNIKLENPEACGYYVGRVVQGINSQAKTPAWLEAKLIQSGLRSINPVVDILNFVMLELGQPMHAFDLAKLQGDIQVRYHFPEEKIVLLDQKEVVLKANTLVISDKTGPIALAGIMGGLDSAVSSETDSLFLESACFAQEAIAGKTRLYGINTDSAYRFERGVDPQLPLKAMQRASELIHEICGGEFGEIIEAKAANFTSEKSTIILRKSRIIDILGIIIPDAQINQILTGLGCKLAFILNQDKNNNTWEVIPPSYRYDITLEIDLIEELARLYGYANIPARIKESVEISAPTVSLLRLKQLWADLGYQEIIAYSFVEPVLQQLLNPEAKGITLLNPISQEMALMRTNMWAGLVGVLKYNMSRQQERIRLFETGLCFYYNTLGELVQKPMIGGIAVGVRMPENWSNPQVAFDFYDLKGAVESCLALSGEALENYNWSVASNTVLHPGQSAVITDASGNYIGECGALHPEVVQRLDLSGGSAAAMPIFVFQLAVEALTSVKPVVYSGFSRFPSVRRDIAVLVELGVSSATLLESIQHVAGAVLQETRVFDIYTGKGIPEGQKSVAIGLILQAESRTLVEAEVDLLMANIVEQLKNKYGAELRD